MKHKLLILFLTLVPLCAAAQESTSANIIGVGSSRILDTYINQEKFSGIGFTYLYIKERAKEGKKWNSVIEHELDLSSTKDRSKDNQMIEGDYNLYWGRYRHWQLFADHPAQARLSLNLMPAAIATYHFPLFGKQFALRYELNVPLVGVMFSPNYGQSYYEIFNRGNYDHNIVPTTFVSAPTFRQMLSLDWRTNDRWSLRIGYLGNYQQAEVNNLKQHIYAHRVMIGIVCHFPNNVHP